MTVMITKMSEGGASTGTVVIRRNLPGRKLPLSGGVKWDLLVSCSPLISFILISSSSSYLADLAGTKTSAFCQWVEEPFDEMDSTLAVQQYIQQTIRKDPQDVDIILTAPETQDEGVWKYEHLR